MNRNFYYFLYLVNKALGYLPPYKWIAVKTGLDAYFIKNYYKHLRISEGVSNEDIDGYSGADALPEVITKVVTEMLSSHPNPLVILDIGCGSGRYLKEIDRQKTNCILYGIDISNDILQKYTAKNIPSARLQMLDIQADNIYYKQQAATFDLIYMNGVIQILSVSKIQETINKLAHMLKPEGKLYIQYPIETETKKSTVGYKRYSDDELSNIGNRSGLKVSKNGALNYLQNNHYIIFTKS
jgi:ubiquinone/menaquinone biosynthesis C-methylase UbiE